MALTHIKMLSVLVLLVSIKSISVQYLRSATSFASLAATLYLVFYLVGQALSCNLFEELTH